VIVARAGIGGCVASQGPAAGKIPPRPHPGRTASLLTLQTTPLPPDGKVDVTDFGTMAAGAICLRRLLCPAQGRIGVDSPAVPPFQVGRAALLRCTHRRPAARLVAACYAVGVKNAEPKMRS
jgi:hypothetical protein